MHLYWTGVAADLWRAGDKSLEWLLTARGPGRGLCRRPRRAGQRHPRAPVHDSKAERGRRRVPLHRPQALRQPDARCGPSSASMAWTRATRPRRRSSTPSCRGTPRAIASRTRGMSSACAPPRATTRSSRARSCPDRYIARVVPAGFAGADLFVLATFQWALTGFANIYYGLAQQLLDPHRGEREEEDLARDLTRAPWPITPRCSTGVAQMVMEVEAIGPYLDRLAEDWTNGVDHGMAWPLKIVAAKHRSVMSAWKVADIGARAGRRVRYLRGLGGRASAPGRAPRPHPPGQSRPHPRDRRQDGAGH